MHSRQVGGAVIGLGEDHSGEQGSHRELAGPATGGQQRFDPGRDRGPVQ